MLSIVAAITVATVAEQLSPAKEGMVECQIPNLQAKTCVSLSEVRQLGPSTYSFDTEILVDTAGPVTAMMHSEVFVKGSEVCQTMTGEEPAGATFLSGGHQLSASETAPYLTKLSASFAPLAGHTICTQNDSSADGVVTVIGTIDGNRVPPADYPMKWVKRSDGWRVAP